MADFCITAVQYSEDNKHIEWVEVREELPERKIGFPRIVSREFVADLIRLKKATFQTRTITAEKKWALGAQVHVIGKDFITTDPDKTVKDNLGNLPLIV